MIMALNHLCWGNLLPIHCNQNNLVSGNVLLIFTHKHKNLDLFIELLDWHFQFSSVPQSCPTLQPHGLQHARPPCPSPTPRACSNSCPLSQWCNPTISCLSPHSPVFNLSQHQGLFHWVGSSHQVAKILELQLQYQSFQWIFRVDFL